MSEPLEKFNHKLNDKCKTLCYTDDRNQRQHFTERNRIMKHFTSACMYERERQAIFQYEEYGFAKHAHFQDKQKHRYGMSS